MGTLQSQASVDCAKGSNLSSRAESTRDTIRPTFVPLHAIDAPDLTTPTAALDRARAERERVAAQAPDDGARRTALEAALRTLQDSWTADHRAYMRSGPRTSRRVSDDPVRVLRREMRAEEKRLRAMLNRTSGTPRQAPPRVSAKAMRGHIARSVQVIRQIAMDFEPLPKFYGRGSLTSRKGGGTFVSMRELNAAASVLLTELREERARVNLAWARYQRTARRDTYRQQDRDDNLRERMALLRVEADLITADLVAATKQRKPTLPPRRGQWTFRNVNSAIREYEAKHGRRPTKAEFNGDPSLPFYTQVRRVLGPNPLTTLDV